MPDLHRQRRADFQRRATYTPRSVYTHRTRGFRYIPVHRFADEGVQPPEGTSVDAWCELPTDVALIETAITMAASRPTGVWIRRDDVSPQFLKIMAVLEAPGVTRSQFEDIIALVADHSWAVDGFARVAPGSALSFLPPP